MKHGGFVYIITNQYNTVLYTGVTSQLRTRIFEHKTKFYPKSFSAKYNCNKIVWFQFLPYIEEAIEREKQIKAGNRKSKEALINSLNPTWKDLWNDIQDFSKKLIFEYRIYILLLCISHFSLGLYILKTIHGNRN